jgi:predicted transglutaminase-like cysteine proteinase
MVTPRQKSKYWVAASCVAVALGAGIAAPAQAMPFAKRLFRFTSAVEFAKPPAPWLAFCRQNPRDCDADPSASHEVDLTDENLDLIQKTNLAVNRKIRPRTDQRHWGVADRWSYPDDGYGDCEDYALLKRKLLIKAGLSPRALLMAVVWDKNAGHAVLVVHTTRGDYILDNLSNKVRVWSETPYRFVKRQSPRDLKQWVYIDGDPRKPNATMVAWENMPVQQKDKAIMVAAAGDAQPATASTEPAKAFSGNEKIAAVAVYDAPAAIAEAPAAANEPAQIFGGNEKIAAIAVYDAPAAIVEAPAKSAGTNEKTAAIPVYDAPAVTTSAEGDKTPAPAAAIEPAKNRDKDETTASIYGSRPL